MTYYQLALAWQMTYYYLALTCRVACRQNAAQAECSTLILTNINQTHTLHS
jgi:hypothetical protein